MQLKTQGPLSLNHFDYLYPGPIVDLVITCKSYTSEIFIIRNYTQKPNSCVPDGSQDSIGKAETTLLYVILEDVTVSMAYKTLCESGNFLTKSDSERKNIYIYAKIFLKKSLIIQYILLFATSSVLF